LSPDDKKAAFDPKEYDFWMPVDVYSGGAEHATMHLIYTRFFHKALRDMGITKGNEPMMKLRNQGQILGPDGQRMSKSRGNVIDPDEQVRNYGADVVRAFLMFGYRWSEGGPWMTDNIQGVVRWLYRSWSLLTEEEKSNSKASDEVQRNLSRKVHQSLKNVGNDLENFEFNTVVSALMELLNAMQDAVENGVVGSPAWDEAKDYYLRMLAPVTPHFAEELWEKNGGKYSVHQQAWPEVNEDIAKDDEITLVVQINGKLRDKITVPAGTSKAEAEKIALSSEVVQTKLDGKKAKKVIVVGSKLVNIVI
jgi:leucyl-tRNA synthetase